MNHVPSTLPWPSEVLPIVLVYHNLCANVDFDEPYCVSVDNIRSQFSILSSECNVIPLGLLADHGYKTAFDRPTIVITADDAYQVQVDVLTSLIRYYCLPVTLFCVSGFVGRNDEFWWDKLHRMLYLCSAKQLKDMHAALSDSTAFQASSSPKSFRHLYSGFFHSFRHLSHDHREYLLNEFARLTSLQLPVRQTHLPADEESVRRFATTGVGFVGAHTHLHEIMQGRSWRDNLDDLCKCRSLLQALTGQEIQDFAYPHGSWLEDFDTTSVMTVQTAGFVRAVAVDIPPSNVQLCKEFAIPRMPAPNVSGPELVQLLRTRSVENAKNRRCHRQ